MKKIGILTFYYKNYNYGGLLQAYALREVISQMGFQCEQISFVRNKKNTYLRKIKSLLSEPASIEIIAVRLRIIYDRLLGRKEVNIEGTIEKFDEFINYIPHSKVVDSKSICDLNSEYDLFVSGSDQVWNPMFANDEYFLSFVKEGKPKISYAASIRVKNIKKSDSQRIRDFVNEYSYISVRENHAKESLQAIGVEKQIDVLPDPTFLLTREEWDGVERMETPLPYKYVFAYLVRNKESLNRIREYALSKKYKVILISDPGYYHKEDDVFVKIGNGVGPREFVNLIKNAEFVFANSFHGTAFSIIYNKQFYVYGSLSVDDRKKTLLTNLGLSDRVVVNDYNFIEGNMKLIDYSNVNSIIQTQREDAKLKLKEVLYRFTD